MVISANELKVKGISAFGDMLQKFQSAHISVRGKSKYVLMTRSEYDRLYEQEILLAQMQVHKDIENGDYQVGNLEEHLKYIGL